MKISQVAVQLYTLRDQCKTVPEIAASLKKVRAIGYEAVQASGLGPIEEAELLRILSGEGLTLCATHEPAVDIVERPEAVAERLAKLGCKYTAYPWPVGVDMGDVQAVRQLAAQLDRAGAVLRAAGQVLTYHNHGIEFVKHAGRTALEILFQETSPENLQAELDTYWVQFGGGDPVAWCERLSGRLPLLHLKDYRFTTQNTPVFGEIGSGTLDFPRIIGAAERAGCEWFIVEQDVCPGDPFDSLKQSFDYIAANLTDTSPA